MSLIRVLLSSAYIIWAIADLSLATDQWTDCWTTGCQPNTWAVVGCGQYGMIEKNKIICTDGYMYECCTIVEEPPTTATITTTTLGPWIDCWQTGCQPDTWAVVGCPQYGKTEIAKFPCQGGYEYQCCTKNENYVEPTIPAINTKDPFLDCWTTGCQSDTWEVVGCEQYELAEVDRFECEGGYEYKCCTENPNYILETDQWYSDCTMTTCLSGQNGAAVCEQYQKSEIDRIPCNGGYEYKCCVINGREENFFPSMNSTDFESITQ